MGSELRDWYDNLPEGLQQADKGSTLDESANTLEGLSEPTIPDIAAQINVVIIQGLDVSSRSQRSAEAVGAMQEVRDHLDDVVNAGHFLNADGSNTELDDDEKRELTDFMDELDNVIGEAEGVEYPGMY